MGRYEELKKKAEKEEKEKELSRIRAKKQKQKERRQRRMRETRRRRKRVTVWNGAPYLSEALVKAIHGDWKTTHENRLAELGAKTITVDDTPYIEARAFRAAANAGALGSNHTNLLTVQVFQGVDDLEPPKETVVEGPGGTKIRKDTGASRLRITEELMRRKFDEATSTIEEKATDKPFDKQPRDVRLAAWAARDNEPWEGPADSLEACFPLEVWRRLSGKVLCYVRAEEEPSEDGE